MIKSVFRELEEQASAAGVNLLAAVVASGSSDSTYYRWRDREFEPRAATARRVSAQIEKMANGHHLSFG